ncbi:MAG: hypothetical protein ACK56F_18480, partial [bacterium]
MRNAPTTPAAPWRRGDAPCRNWKRPRAAPKRYAWRPPRWCAGAEVDGDPEGNQPSAIVTLLMRLP